MLDCGLEDGRDAVSKSATDGRQSAANRDDTKLLIRWGGTRIPRSGGKFDAIVETHSLHSMTKIPA